MPTGIIRALKVKSTKARDSHESEERSSKAECSRNASLKAPRISTSVPLPRAPILSKVPPHQSFASSATIIPSAEILNNSTSKRISNFDLKKKGNRRSRLRKKWFPRHRKASSPSSSRGAAPENESCFTETSEPSLCLSPRPNIPNPQEDTDKLSTSHKECQFASKFALENVTGHRNSAARMIVSGLKLPMDFALYVAKGFHNAPRLYGDDTVRPLRKIDGLKTGLEASGRVVLYFSIVYSFKANTSRNLLSVSTTAFLELLASRFEAPKKMVFLDLWKVWGKALEALFLSLLQVCI